MKFETRYICTGNCHGISKAPKNCGSSTCNRYEKPLSKSLFCPVCQTPIKSSQKSRHKH